MIRIKDLKDKTDLFIALGILIPSFLAATAMVSLGQITDVFAPNARHWEALVGETLTLSGLDTQGPDAGYPVELSCTITEKTTSTGQIGMSCQDVN